VSALRLVPGTTNPRIWLWDEVLFMHHQRIREGVGCCPAHGPLAGEAKLEWTIISSFGKSCNFLAEKASGCHWLKLVVIRPRTSPFPFLLSAVSQTFDILLNEITRPMIESIVELLPVISTIHQILALITNYNQINV
jgi:hypothetical protein